MEINEFSTDNGRIAEIFSKEVLIQDVESSLDLIGNIYYQGYDAMILREEHLVASFFDLKTKLAGEVLQKFSNYRMRLAVVGDWSGLTSKSLQDFIRESNAGKYINFVTSTEEAFEKLSKP